MINVQTQATLKAVGKARDAHAKNIKISLDAICQIAAKESQILVPRDTNFLAESMRTDSKGAGFGAIATLTYTAPYAWQVHEDPTKAHDPPTQYKYVTQAIRNRRGSMTAKLKRQMTVGMAGVAG